MKYENTVSAKFIERPNRFVAYCELDGENVVCHVKNTGRCKELLIPGVEVILEIASNLNRKTKYDLISVYKEGFGWVNIDSQVPNKVAFDWLKTQDYSFIKPEYTFGKSRVDFYMERIVGEPSSQVGSALVDGAADDVQKSSNGEARAAGALMDGATDDVQKNFNGEARAAGALMDGATDDVQKSSNVEKWLLEIKGCTLEINGKGYFPDAATDRGAKHCRELAGALAEGYHAAIGFVIAMNGIDAVIPNMDKDPKFCHAIEEAYQAGVEIWYLPCKVTPDTIEIIDFIKRT